MRVLHNPDQDHSFFRKLDGIAYEIMGGEISVDSIESEGSTFWFTVPLKSAKSLPSGGPSFLFAAASKLRQVKVLVVNSEAVTGNMLRSYFQAAGLRCDFVPDNREALQLLARQERLGDPYQVVMVELSADSSQAFELAGSVFRDAQLKSARLILLSAYDRKGLHQEALKAGYSAYLHHPLRQSQLIDSIARLTNGLIEEVPQVQSETLNKAGGISQDTVLLAEDNLALQDLTVRQLKKLGVTVEAVSTGKQVVESVSQGPYALVLMDCQMPELDGLEATIKIRQLESKTGKHLPIVALTASVMEGDKEKCLTAGMDDFLSKPVSMDQLERILQKWMPSRKVETDSVCRTSDKTEQAPETTSVPIDIDKLHQCYGPSDLLDILKMFLPEAERLLADIEESAVRQDKKSLLGSAHQLKGLAASVAADELSSVSQEIEAVTRQEDWQKVETSCARLKGIFKKVSNSITTTLSG